MRKLTKNYRLAFLNNINPYYGFPMRLWPLTTTKLEKNLAPASAFQRKPIISKKQINAFRTAWYTNQLLSWNCEGLQRYFANLNYTPSFNTTTNSLPSPVLRKLLVNRVRGKKLKTNKNTIRVNVEFYQLWFKLLPLKYLLYRKRNYNFTAEGLSSRLWSVFRDARFSHEARKLRDRFRLNWPKANLLNAVSKAGKHYFRPILYLKERCIDRFTEGEKFKNLAIICKRQAVTLLLRLCIAKKKSKSYKPLKRASRSYNRLANLYNRTAKKYFFQAARLQQRYFIHIKKYRCLTSVRSKLYFNLLTGYSNIFYNNTGVSPNNYCFNLTNRKVEDRAELLRKRMWSSTHNIRTVNYPTPGITVKLGLLSRTRYNRFIWPKTKPVISYKPLLLQGGQAPRKRSFKVKSRLKIKPRLDLDKLAKSLNTIKKQRFVGDLKTFFLNAIKTNLTRRSLFNFNNVNFSSDKYPASIFHLPLHLRQSGWHGLPSYALIINLSHKNYFFTFINARTGEVKKVFSSGYSGGKTKKVRKSPLMFSKVFNLLMVYLKQKAITKLRFVHILQYNVTSNMSFQDEKKINWYPTQFKRNKIRVRRWIYELKRSHGHPPRGPKLRRK